MVIGFVCPLTQHRIGFAPMILKLAYDAGVTPVMSWRTTSATTPLPFAVGLAEVTPAQYSALQSRSDMWVINASSRDNLVNSIPVAERTKLQNVLTANGLNPGIQITDTIRVAFDKLIQSICPGTLQDVIAEMQRNHGVAA